MRRATHSVKQGEEKKLKSSTKKGWEQNVWKVFLLRRKWRRDASCRQGQLQAGE